MTTVAVIGCTHAGTFAATSILAEHPDWTVHVFERNGTLSFLSCGIVLWVGDHVSDPKKMFYSSPAALAEAGATMIKPARHRLTNLFFIFLPVLSFYCVRSASTGCRFEALLAGYSPKMIPSSAENRNAPMTSPAEGSTVNCSTVGM